jgi:hypothetical protein
MARACHGILALAILVPATLAAQPVISAKSGMVTYVEGRVFLDDVPLARGSQISSFPEMKPGGVLRTEVGRVEVLLPPGYLLRMGDDSSFRMLNNQLVDTRVEMLTGSAIVDVTGANKDDSVAVTLQSGVTTLSKAGSYRFDCQPPRLKVLLGAANGIYQWLRHRDSDDATRPHQSGLRRAGKPHTQRAELVHYLVQLSRRAGFAAGARHRWHRRDAGAGADDAQRTLRADVPSGEKRSSLQRVGGSQGRGPADACRQR